MLYFNPLEIKTTKEKWSQPYSSKLEKVKDLSRALKYDLLVANPYNLIIDNSKNVLLAEGISKIDRAAAAAIVTISCIYTSIMYGAFAYSFGSSLRTIAVFANSNKLELVAYTIKEMGVKLINFGIYPAQNLFYEIPKKIVFGIPSFLNNSVNNSTKLCRSVFDDFLSPLFRIVKKVLVWNYLQLVMAVRVVFDHTSEVFNWARQNVFNPFWKVKVEPKVSLAKETLKGYVALAK